MVHLNIACTVCGCVCDDLRITVDGDRVSRADGACALAEPWLFGQNTREPPAAMVEGREVAFEAAVERADAILREARSPLIYGLSRSSTEGQQAAVRLADLLGATIDTTASLGHAPSVMAIQAVGESTCTLGEAKTRADLVVFWGSNPVESHPRHFGRYSVPSRDGRTVVVVDVQPTATSQLADVFVPVEPGRDFEALWTLRGLIRGERPMPGCDIGAPLAALEDLAQRILACKWGIVFFGFGLTRSGVGHRSVQALLQLVTDLNDHTRFYVRRMRGSGDVAGADTVLAWQTGFPFSVNLARGYPRYGPGEFSGLRMLVRDEVDAALFVGSQGTRRFSPAGLARLREIPTIVLDSPTVDAPFTPTVKFTTAVYGVHLPGTAYRMDEVPIPLRSFLSTKYPSDAEVLGAIESRFAASFSERGGSAR